MSPSNVLKLDVNGIVVQKNLKVIGHGRSGQLY